MIKASESFVQLLYVFYSSALQGLGKIKNPITDKVERNLKQASEAIEMMEMIKQKTNGNLIEDETKLLDEFLTQLRLNYVDESQKDNKDIAAIKEKTEA